MAGDWIKMRADLMTHPKVVRIASALRADKLRVIGGLFAVWCLFDTHSEDGRLDGYTAEAIDDEVRCDGISAAMEAVDWLEIGPDYVATPRFDSHNGRSAKRRAQETERKRNERNTSAPDADKKRSREEKRREEVNTTATATREASVDIEVFPISNGWAPGNTFAVQARLMGLPVLDPKAMAEGLSEFTAYWLSRPGEQRTQAEWEHALAKSLKHRQVTSVEASARQSSTPRPQRPSATPRTPNHGGHDAVEPA